MKKILLVLLILCTALAFITADIGSQWDLYLQVPYYIGIHADNEDVGAALDYTFVVPEVNWHYYFGTDTLHAGVGFDMYTLVLESLIMPSISVESFMGPLILTARVSGGGFFFFGLVTDSVAGSVFFPEASIAYRLGKKQRFSLGTSMKFIIAPEAVGMDTFAYVGTVFGRWTL